jgi:hypothetical protein
MDQELSRIRCWTMDRPQLHYDGQATMLVLRRSKSKTWCTGVISLRLLVFTKPRRNTRTRMLEPCGLP